MRGFRNIFAMIPAIVCNNVRCKYRSMIAVQGVSFQVAHGEVFGLLGPNGAGKTSILSMLAGIKYPSDGSIQINGLNYATHRDQIKRLIGYVPQALAFYTRLTGLENLQFFCGIFQIFGDAAKNRIQHVLKVVGLTDRAKDIAETYSGGMKRRLNIAIALLHEPKILLMDEPTAGVDPHSRNSIFECIEQLSRTGTTVIYSTHYMEETERLCKNIAIVDQGQIIAMDSPQNLCESIGGVFFQVGVQGKNRCSLVDILSQMDSIAEVNLKDSLLEITTKEPQKVLQAFMGITDKLDIQISSLNISNPSLETVFLKLTGKGLRDQQDG
ncbi:MAG: transporter-like protein [Parachlamydiales bacterium]|nr:transporter-like protein [Parachlamydiales bacterium]